MSKTSLRRIYNFKDRMQNTKIVIPNATNTQLDIQLRNKTQFHDQDKYEWKIK